MQRLRFPLAWAPLALLALVSLGGCATRPRPFGDALKRATFEFYVDELERRSAEIQSRGPSADELAARYREEALAAPDPASFHRVLARLFAEIEDPHIEYRAPEHAGGGAEESLRLTYVPVGEAWHVLSGPKELEERAGPLPELLAVDGVPATRAGAGVGAALRGPPGSTARVEVRGADGAPVEVAVRRPGRTRGDAGADAAETLETKQGTILRLVRPLETMWLRSERRGDLGYLRVLTFSTSQLDLDVGAILRAIDAELDALAGCESLIVDLQSNNGGVFAAGAVLLGRLIDEELTCLVAHRRYLFGLVRVNQRIVVRPERVLGVRRIAVLVDELTGSTAELVAAYLARERGAVLVGAQTRGAQYPVARAEGPDGSTLSFGGNAYSYPDLERFQPQGLTPDVRVPLDLELARREGFEAALSEARIRRLGAALEALGLGGEDPPEWVDALYAFRGEE